MFKKQKIAILIFEFLLLLLYLVVIGSSSVQPPFFGDINIIDEGQFGAWISHMLHGEYLYKDFYAAYGPFYIYPAYLLAKLLGPSVILLRVVYKVIFVLLGVIVARLIMTKLKVRVVMQYVFVLLLVFIPDFGLRQGVGLLAIFLLSLLIESKKLWISVLAGASVAVSFLISSDIGIFIFLIYGITLIYYLVTTKYIKEMIQKSCIIFCTAALIFFLFVVWSEKEGWFSSYVISIFSDLKIFSGIDLPNGQGFPNLLHLFPNQHNLYTILKYLLSKELLLYWVFFFYIVFFIFLFIQFLLRKKNEDTQLLFSLSLFGFLVSTILIGRSGHFSFVVSPLLIILSYFLSRLFIIFEQEKSGAGRLLAAVGIAVITLFLVRTVSLYRTNFEKVLSLPQIVLDKRKTLPFVGSIVLSSGQRESIQKVQQFVFTNTTEKERVFFVNNEPVMYLLVSRDNSTRYDFPYIADTIEKRLEIVSDLRSKPPRFIFVNKSAWDVDGVSNAERMPEVMKYIHENYQFYKQIDKTAVYSKKLN